MDPVRAHLVEREVAQHVIDGGLDYLTSKWSRVVSDVESGETWTWDEWVNDLDTRQIIHELLQAVPEAAAARPVVERADARFREVARKTEECAWGEANADRHGWTWEENWWYWFKPPTPYE